VTLTVEQNLLVFTHLYRIGRSERRAAIDAALEMANLADRRDSRVDKLSGGMRRRLLIARALVHRPRLVLLDEPTVGLDPQVRQELWALIDALRAEGTTILMSTHYIEEAERLADTVLIMSHGEASPLAPGRARSPARGPHGGRGLRLAVAARRGRGEGAGRWLPHAPHGTSIAVLGVEDADGRARRASAGPRTSRTSSSSSPGERSTDGAPGAATRPHRRLERPALTGVLVREIVNFSSYWRSATFSSTVEPTIYLLAFGFGFGSLVSTIGGYDYVEFVGTGTVATAVLFSSAFPAMFGTFVKYQFHVHTTPSWPPRRHEELVTPRRSGSRRAPASTAACR
jgi:energy-coupling factor transporter ATP-binding protein EcfA2